MSEIKFEYDGYCGRHIAVYEQKVVLTTKASVGSFLTGNFSDGEKTIYFTDCIGVQFKKSTLFTGVGYLQFETASSTMNNRTDNFFNENTFTFEPAFNNVTNEQMEEVAAYCKKRIDEVKAAKNNPVAAVSPADELKKFKELLDMGVITQEEFDAKKKELLGL